MDSLHLTPDKTLDLISRLLAKADSTTPEEAEALIAKAQELATTNAIDLAVARQHTAQRFRREEPTIKRLNIGLLGEKTNAKKVDLFDAVARNNDVQIDIARNSTYVIMFGFPSDIEVVEALYTSLLVQMVDACNREMKKGDYRNETVAYETRVDDGWGYSYTDYVYKPMDGRTFRRNFYEGFTVSISERMCTVRLETEKAAAEASTRETTVVNEDGDEVIVTVSDDVALVLVGKREEVASFHNAKSNARGSWRGSNGSAYASGARSAGKQAGSNARLTSQRALPGARGELR